MKKRPIEERFWEKVNKTESCWLWGAFVARTGYGQVNVDGRMRYAHRVAYELLVGPIPHGLQVDHVCFTRSCVNPGHLRLVTNKQNGENRREASSRSKSGVRGVWWDKSKGKWSAGITHNGRRVTVGRFDSVEEAQDAVRNKRIELFTHNERDRS